MMKVAQDEQTSSEAMETDNDQNVATNEILIFMEFDKKMKDYLFDNKIFFRMVRFEETPLIQINNHIFKGEYRSCIGTNLFFTDYEAQEPENLFSNQGSIKLKHVATQFKILILNPVQIPSDMANLPQPLHDIQINEKCDTKTLLKKFSQGKLNLQEDLLVVPRKKDSVGKTITKKSKVISKKEKQEELREDLKPKTQENPPKMSTNSSKQPNILKKLGISNAKPRKTEVTVDILTHKFEKLKKLAMRPTRRKKESEPVAKCDEKYMKAYDYNSLKCTIIKPSDFFRTISESFNEKTLVGAVDIDRSILQGVIDPSSQFYRILTEEEKLALLSIKNLENLSMAARYKVIKSHLDHLNSSVATLQKSNEKDDCGRTVREKIRIYRRLVRVLGGIVTQKYCYDSDIEDN